MPLKTYDTKDAIPADQQASAVELKDGKWVVDEVDPELGEKGKKALQDERDARKRAEDQARAAEKERDDLKRENDARSKGVTEEELKRIRDAEALARKPIEDELAETRRKHDVIASENRKLKLTDRLQKLALDAGVMPDRIEDAMMHLDKRTDLGDSGGIIFKDKEFNVTTDTAETFFPKFKIEKPWLFKGTGGKGGVEGDPPAPLAAGPQSGGHPAVSGRF